MASLMHPDLRLRGRAPRWIAQAASGFMQTVDPNASFLMQKNPI